MAAFLEWDDRGCKIVASIANSTREGSGLGLLQLLHNNRTTGTSATATEQIGVRTGPIL
jgi:hypothetical protein